MIEDLLDYDPRHLEGNVHQGGGNLLADSAPRWRGEGHDIHRKSDNDCRHKLMVIQSRTDPVNEEADSSTKCTVATYCHDCLWHFDITIDYTSWRSGQTPCKMNDQEHPLHHLQHVESVYSEREPHRLRASKYKPIHELHRFACSQLSCPVQIEIEISKPRLDIDILAPILDIDQVRARGERAIREDPTRFEGASAQTPFQALGYLRTYLQNVMSGIPNPPKRIAKRNKKLTIAFGGDCDDLFKYLDFVTTTGEESDVGYFKVATNKAYFGPPPLSPLSSNPLCLLHLCPNLYLCGFGDIY